MEKIDFKKELKSFYKPSTDVVTIVTVPAMSYFMIDGAGDPSTAPAFKQAIEALYGVSYAAKFMVRKNPAGFDFTVMPLEGLWWSETMADFTSGNRDAWQWTLMIMQPGDIVTAELAHAAIEQAKAKKNLVALPKIRFEQFDEGKSAQIMHVGPFSTEGPVIRRVHDFIAGEGSRLRGKHHEIYLSDFRKTAPEKLKTVLRQPME